MGLCFIELNLLVGLNISSCVQQMTQQLVYEFTRVLIYLFIPLRSVISSLITTTTTTSTSSHPFYPTVVYHYPFSFSHSSSWQLECLG